MDEPMVTIPLREYRDLILANQNLREQNARMNERLDKVDFEIRGDVRVIRELLEKK